MTTATNTMPIKSFTFMLSPIIVQESFPGKQTMRPKPGSNP